MWLRSLCCFSSLTTLTTLFYFTTVKKLNIWLHSLRCFSSLILNGNLWLCFCTFTTIKMKFLTTLATLFFLTDCTHYAALLSPLLKWNIWLCSLHCFSSLTTLTTLFYFTTVKKLNIWLHSLRCFSSLILNGHLWLRSLCCCTFTTIKMKFLTTLAMLFFLTDCTHHAVLLSPLLKWNIWLSSLRCFSSLTTLTMLFYFTIIKMKYLTTLTLLFFFTDYTHYAVLHYYY